MHEIGVALEVVNLAEFDIGEDLKVVVLSVTEGEDKPVKYPLMFRVCDAALLNKIDLLAHLDYDLDKALNYIREVNPSMPIFQTSVKKGDGMQDWIAWLEEQVAAKKKSA